MATPGSNPTPKYRNDYKPVPYKVEQVGLAVNQLYTRSGLSKKFCCRYTQCTRETLIVVVLTMVTGAADLPAGRGDVARVLSAGLCASLRGLHAARDLSQRWGNPPAGLWHGATLTMSIGNYARMSQRQRTCHLHEVSAAGRKDVKLVSVKVGGEALSEGDYKLAPDSLTIPSPPSGSFQVSNVPQLK